MADMSSNPVSASPAIVWFRNDLRLTDHPALRSAAETGNPFVLVYILDDVTPGRWKLGGAARWWLHNSLASLGVEIAARGGSLTLRRGNAADIIYSLAQEVGAGSVHFHSAVEPWQLKQDQILADRLQRLGVAVHVSEGAGLFPPGSVCNQAGEPFKVFSPFWRSCLKYGLPRAPCPPPTQLKGLTIPSDLLGDWDLIPTNPDWAGGLRATWRPGEAAAKQKLDAFVQSTLQRYGEHRDYPSIQGTSRLSPHLRFGEISPVQVWAALAERRDTDKFLSELGWREFSRHLLAQFPELPERNFRTQFDALPWKQDLAALRLWRRGQTGYPIVDAGMRELWTTGWMHNRVRMIVASFLVKHLLVDWRLGEDWFWDTLVDADLASNAASWQWVAGSGADAAPYFRIFNPISQAEKFDPEGKYLRRWLPEVAELPTPEIFAPWLAETFALRAANVTLGETYPGPMVDHAEAREAALAAFESIKSSA